MIKYSPVIYLIANDLSKLRTKLSILRMGKKMNQLNDDGKIELTICELLYEQFIIDEFFK